MWPLTIVKNRIKSAPVFGFFFKKAKFELSHEMKKKKSFFGSKKRKKFQKYNKEASKDRNDVEDCKLMIF